jgi:hypothetical protein
VKERQKKIHDDIRATEVERRKTIEGEPQQVAKQAAQPPPPREETAPVERKRPASFATTSGEKGETQHRYLQSLLKKMAESKGYKATLEALTADGKGRVDVLLEKGDETIACEISVSTDETHELDNIKKCLSSGYSEVVVCTDERKKLEKIKKLVSDAIEANDLPKVLFFAPEELMSYLAAKDAKEVFEEKKIKGYNVKVKHPTSTPPSEISDKNRTIADVIIRSVKKLKKP